MEKFVTFPFKRINFFAAPGASKSTTAAKTFSALKDAGYCPELVQEVCKEWAWEQKKWHDFDQFYIFGQQIRRELIPLKGGADCIVSDSPLLLQYYYANKYKVPAADALADIACAFEAQYPSLNFFVRRSNRKYETRGRYETLEQVQIMDKEIRNIMPKINSFEIDASDVDSVMKIILPIVGK